MGTRVLLIATEWWPSKGGVSSFNIELACALARIGHETHCVVKRADGGEYDDARARHVTLWSAAEHGVTDGAPFGLGFSPDVIVGHDRWTGPQAARWRERLPQSRLAHFLHVHPGRIDGLKSDSSIEERAGRIEACRLSIENADASFAVGRQLAAQWLSDVPGSQIHAFTPGLPTTLPMSMLAPPGEPRVLLMGRAEDFDLKGIGTIARAMRAVVDRHHKDSELAIRGTKPGSDLEFERLVRRHYPKPRRFVSRHFDPSKSTIVRDLVTASLVVQPSLEEGFGLVTLEALAVGVPILTSSRCGVARVIEDAGHAFASAFIVEAGNDLAWADAISNVLGDLPRARELTQDLRNAISRSHSWDREAAMLFDITVASSSRPAATISRSPIDVLNDANRTVRELPRKTDGHWIPRAQEAEVTSWIRAPIPEYENGLLLIVGDPGTGKTALVSSLVKEAQSSVSPLLAIKADFIPAHVASEDELRAHLNLSHGIVGTLTKAASLYGTATLLIDQLDALCEVVDNRTARLNVLLRLIRQAINQDVRVVASIRPFELRHEARLRALQDAARVVHLGPLAVDELRTVLSDIPLPDSLDPSLRSPHALDLMVYLRRTVGPAVALPTSLGELQKRFWSIAIAEKASRKRAAIALALAIADQGELWVAPDTTGVNDEALGELEGVGLVRRTPDQHRVGFRHQTLADFAQATRLIEEGSLANYIRTNSDSFQIRPLARSALLHLRTSAHQSYVEILETVATADALHLRLLAIDTLLESETPTPSEKRVFQRLVAGQATRRRALNGIARRPGWLAAFGELLPAWLADYADQAVLLAIGYLKADPSPALQVLQTTWMGTESGHARMAQVLARADKLDESAHATVFAIAPQLVRSSNLYLGPIVKAVAASSKTKAVELCARCFREQVRALNDEDEPVYGDLRIVDELTEVDAPPAVVLDAIEPLFEDLVQRTDFRPRMYQLEKELEELLGESLGELSKNEPEIFLQRARNPAIGSRLLKTYARVLTAMSTHVKERVRWAIDDEQRLALDPESLDLIAALSASLDADDVALLDDAIETVRLCGRSDRQLTADLKRSFDRGNRAYRLHLRERLPASLREQRRVSADQAELHQVSRDEFSPDRGPRGGFVRSPMTAQQLARASNEAVRRAVAKPRVRPFEVDDNGQPIGGADQIISELCKLAESEPESVARRAEFMRDNAMQDRARELLRSVAEHHDDSSRVEALIRSLVASSGEPLDYDDQCASAFDSLARRAPLSDASVTAIVSRVESASPIALKSDRVEDATRDESNDRKRKLALFRDGYGGMVIPDGAYRWLDALAVHFGQVEAPDPDVWARVVRAALRADPRPKTWRAVLLSWGRAWFWLGGSNALQLLRDIAGSSLSPVVAPAMAHAYAANRSAIDPSEMSSHLQQLIDAGAYAPVGEHLGLLVAETADPLWTTRLASLRDEPYNRDIALGIVGAATQLLPIPSLRARMAEILEDWISVAQATDLKLLFEGGEQDTVWRSDAAGIGLVRGLLHRVAELESNTLESLAGVLEGFLDQRPELVLDVAEAILSNALTASPETMYRVVSECLALSISLRIALPAQAMRIHGIFEQALAADAPAAVEVLDTLDGRLGGGTLWPLRRRARRRASRRSGRAGV